MGAKKRALEVVEIATGKVVSSVDVTGKPDRTVDKVAWGMMTNMDLDNFSVRDTNDQRPEGD